MASAYSRLNNKIGVACVTAGPGATNAIPGLAEAFVESTPIMVFSVKLNTNIQHIAQNQKQLELWNCRDNIIPIVKPLIL